MWLLIHRTLQTTTTDWLTCLLVRSSRLVLGVPLWASRRVSRHPRPGPWMGSWRRRRLMSRSARWRSGGWAHNLWEGWRSSGSSAGLPWRSCSGAQGTARGGRGRRGQTGGRGRSRKGEASQGECAMDDHANGSVNTLRTWAMSVCETIITNCEQRCVQSQCMCTTRSSEFRASTSSVVLCLVSCMLHASFLFVLL